MQKPFYEISWSGSALTELQAILAFWDEHNASPLFGDRLTDEIDNALLLAAALPFKARLTNDDFTYFILVRRYEIFYRVIGDVLDGAVHLGLTTPPKHAPVLG